MSEVGLKLIIDLLITGKSFPSDVSNGNSILL